MLGGERDIFIGHPVVADRPELTVQVTQTGDTAWGVEVHNPTADTVETTLRLNTRFGPFTGKTLPVGRLTLPAGSSVHLEL